MRTILGYMQLTLTLIFLIALFILLATSPVQAIDLYPDCEELGGLDVTSIFIAKISDDEEQQELADVMLGGFEIEHLTDDKLGTFDVTVFKVVGEDIDKVILISFDEFDCVLLYKVPETAKGTST